MQGSLVSTRNMNNLRTQNWSLKLENSVLTNVSSSLFNFSLQGSVSTTFRILQIWRHRPPALCSTMSFSSCYFRFSSHTKLHHAPWPPPECKPRGVVDWHEVSVVQYIVCSERECLLSLLYLLSSNKCKISSIQTSLIFAKPVLCLC